MGLVLSQCQIEWSSDKMAVSIFDRILSFIGGDSAVQRVADDPALAAELILLMHVAFADGEQRPEEMIAFKEIVRNNFGIEGDQLKDVAEYLKDFAYETTTGQAAAMVAEMAPERRQNLLKDLLTMACADSELVQQETAMISRVAHVFNLTPQEIQTALESSRCGCD